MTIVGNTVRGPAISERLSTLRKRRRLTQTALGEMVGLNDHHISGYERGGSIPVDRLERIAVALGVPANDIVRGTAVLDLSQDEIEAVQVLRTLPAEGRAYIAHLMAGLAAGEVSR